MQTKIIYRLNKPRSSIFYFSVNTDTVEDMKQEGYIATARRWVGV